MDLLPGRVREVQVAVQGLNWAAEQCQQRRAAGALAVLLLAAALNFLIPRLMPGSPLRALDPECVDWLWITISQST
ncbi:MAG: hypothetical protein ACRDZ4_16575, partial [Egibacteraceae bacterium]